MRTVAIRFGIVDRPDPHRSFIFASWLELARESLFYWCVVNWLRVGTGSLRASAELPRTYCRLRVLLLPSSAFVTLGLVDGHLGICADGRNSLAGHYCPRIDVHRFCRSLDPFVRRGYSTGLGCCNPLTVCLAVGHNERVELDRWIRWSLLDGRCDNTGALGIMALISGNEAEACVAFALCGALIGFLIFNFPPASIFLGDAGNCLLV